MKALIYTAPETLRYGDMPDPVAGDGEDLIRIESAGICGSDMHAFLGHDDRRPAPLVLGHEVSGLSTRTGRRVTINPLVSCGQCNQCRRGRDNLCPRRQIISMPPREGGFADAVVMPLGNLVDVPDTIGPDQAALAEPIACGWHAVRLALAAAPDATTALVIGGGAIGLGAALCLKAQGVTDVLIVEPNATRRSYLDRHCGQQTLDTAALEPGRVFDIVVDGVGYEPTRRTASAHARPGGVIAHIGLGSAEGGLDIRRMTLQEISFLGTYTYTAQDFRDTCAAMFDGRLGALDWTEARPLGDGQSAFADIRAGRSAAPKIILKPDYTGDDNG
jgi:threonine dehydrogenase-like Zn-dependent dehydrogenase